MLKYRKASFPKIVSTAFVAHCRYKFTVSDSRETHPTVKSDGDVSVDKPTGLGRTGGVGVGPGDMLAPVDLLLVLSMLPFVYQTKEILYLILYTCMLFIPIILPIEYAHIRLIAMSRHTKHAISLHACLCHPLFTCFPTEGHICYLHYISSLPLFYG